MENETQHNKLMLNALNALSELCVFDAKEIKHTKNGEWIASYFDTLSAISSSILNKLFKVFKEAGSEIESKAFLEMYTEVLKRNYEKIYGKLK